MKAQLDKMEVIQRMERLNAVVERNLARLALATSSLPDTALPSIQNLFDNGAIEFSKDAYVNDPMVPGDIDYEAYNFFRHDEADTLLVEDDVHALKSVTHTLYAANEGMDAEIPIWDRVNGWAEWGSTGTSYDICCPLPMNFVREGVSFIIQFISKVNTASDWPEGVEVAVMFYDNTVGQEKIIEGGPFALSYALGGASGSTALEYKIIGRTDYGEEIESNVLPVPDAPATLTTTDYVGLSWENAAGYINFDIYKKVGGVFYLQANKSNGETSYRDQGDAPQATVAGYPSVSGTVAKAYVETQGFAPTTTWERTTVVIRTPPTYDTSLTTGRQWVRIRLTGLTADDRQLLIDRIGISTGDGGWARSANDMRVTNSPSTTANSSDQGNIGIEPPDIPHHGGLPQI